MSGENFVNFSFFDIYFKDQIGYVSGNFAIHETQARMFKTNDGGLTWTMFYSTDPWGCGAGSFSEGAFFVTPDHRFMAKICHYIPEIIETVDGGNSWVATQNYIDTHIDYNITCLVDDTHYVVDQLSTSDGGASWDTINKIDGTTCYDFIDISHGICATNNGIIAETFDYGLTWDTLLSDTTLSFYCVTMKDNNTLFAGGNKMLKSSDGGINWNEVYSSPQIRDIKFIDSNIGFAATHNGGSIYADCYGDILKTIDGGDTWQINYHSDFMSFNEIFIIDDSTLVSCGNQTVKSPNIQGTYFIKTITQGN
ncbi:MAG: hypothetical protein IPM77_00725 [Crocinitomicaceae bacterium]|nr:hypothetical protein [Crocinitomicaceae bacterium]